jgi:hypothetical protein
MFLPTAMLYGLAGALLAALAIGIPSDVIPNPIFGRPSTPVRPQDYAFLAVTAVLAGVLAASFAFPQTRTCSTQQGRATAGGLLTFLAVGCPTCNKVIVLLIGASGALDYFAPLQPLLGIASIGLLLVAIWVRWKPVFAPTTGGASGLPITPPSADGASQA